MSSTGYPWPGSFPKEGYDRSTSCVRRCMPGCKESPMVIMIRARMINGKKPVFPLSAAVSMPAPPPFSRLHPLLANCSVAWPPVVFIQTNEACCFDHLPIQWKIKAVLLWGVGSLLNNLSSIWRSPCVALPLVVHSCPKHVSFPWRIF